MNSEEMTREVLYSMSVWAPVPRQWKDGHGNWVGAELSSESIAFFVSRVRDDTPRWKSRYTPRRGEWAGVDRTSKSRDPII